MARVAQFEESSAGKPVPAGRNETERYEINTILSLARMARRGAHRSTLLLTGCVGVLPIPQLSNQPIHGTRLRGRETAFVRAGTTSASELFGALGTDCVCDPRHRAVALSWELPGGHGIWWIASSEAAVAGEFEWTRWRAFFVAFDTNNVVIAAATRRLSSNKSLHEQLEAWAVKAPRPT